MAGSDQPSVVNGVAGRTGSTGAAEEGRVAVLKRTSACRGGRAAGQALAANPSKGQLQSAGARPTFGPPQMAVSSPEQAIEPETAGRRSLESAGALQGGGEATAEVEANSHCVDGVVSAASASVPQKHSFELRRGRGCRSRSARAEGASATTSGRTTRGRRLGSPCRSRRPCRRRRSCRRPRPSMVP
jgi:hypothetical protein